MSKELTMQCSRVNELLPDHSVELLDASTRRAVERHLELCDGCRRELRLLESVVALVEEHGSRTPPPGLFHAVRNRIETGEVPQQRPAWWAWLYARPARAAAMGLAMGAVAMGLFLPVGPTHSLPPVGLHPTPISGGLVASGELATSIRQHAMAAGEGPLADRVAWEAMAQLAMQERSRRAPGVE